MIITRNTDGSYSAYQVERDSGRRLAVWGETATACIDAMVAQVAKARALAEAQS